MPWTHEHLWCKVDVQSRWVCNRRAIDVRTRDMPPSACRIIKSRAQLSMHKLAIPGIYVCRVVSAIPKVVSGGTACSNIT